MSNDWTQSDLSGRTNSPSFDVSTRSIKSTKSQSNNDGKPRRALSAYNYFFQSERNKILESIPLPDGDKPRRSHGKIGFADLARSVAAKWKVIDEETKNHFEELAARDKERYQQEMAAWKEQQKSQSALAASHFTQQTLDDSIREASMRGFWPQIQQGFESQPQALYYGLHQQQVGNFEPIETHYGKPSNCPVSVESLREMLRTWDDESLDFFIGAFR